jgi:hypothetical protein
MLSDGGSAYRNYSGCGNTINGNHPIVREMIFLCLRHWVHDFHVDGFRFDLASILSRDRNGDMLPNPPIVELIAEDPLLADTKVIAEAWDAAGAYQVGSFASLRWAEWNGKYRDEVRRYWRGDYGQTGHLATRLAGSSDLYGDDGRQPYHSINFVTSHDGFPLNDLVSYREKHNEANGEENRDGDNSSFSENYGVEGPSTDAGIEALRARQIRNLLSTLLLSQGVHAGFAYTYVFGPSTSYAAWPVGAYCGWVQSAATGVRNDILYDPRAGCDEPATRDYLQGLDCWPRPVWYTYRRLAWLLARTDRVALTNDDDSGLTIAKFVLREPLSVGPDGEPLRRSWSNFYVVWVDQTRSTKGPVTVAFGYSAPEWADGGGVAIDGGLFERLNLLPWIDPDTIVGNVDARGFALPVVDWSSANWRPFEALASRPSARPNPYRSVEGYTRILLMDIQPCNPEDSRSTALAPLCFFTNTAFFRVLG